MYPAEHLASLEKSPLTSSTPRNRATMREIALPCVSRHSHSLLERRNSLRRKFESANTPQCVIAARYQAQLRCEETNERKENGHYGWERGGCLGCLSSFRGCRHLSHLFFVVFC